MAHRANRAVYSGAVMVTLKALSACGIFPELDAEKVEERFRPAVAQALARALDSAFKDSPGSVVDNCRDAMPVILSSWLAQNGSAEAVIEKELAKVAAAIKTAPYEKICAGDLGKVCAKLHSRNKKAMRSVKRSTAPSSRKTQSLRCKHWDSPCATLLGQRISRMLVGVI